MTTPSRPVRVRARVCAALLALTAWTAGCDGEDDGGEDEAGETGSGDLSHAADIQPIWDANCVSNCHEAGGIAASLDLSDAYDNIVGVAAGQAPGLSYVEAGAADMSYIVDKLRGTQLDAGGQGGTMPAGGASPLPEATISTIEAWIDAGAQP